VLLVKLAAGLLTTLAPLMKTGTSHTGPKNEPVSASNHSMMSNSTPETVLTTAPGSSRKLQIV
jgi:hypothetical protein